MSACDLASKVVLSGIKAYVLSSKQSLQIVLEMFLSFKEQEVVPCPPSTDMEISIPILYMFRISLDFKIQSLFEQMILQALVFFSGPYPL